MEPPPPPPTTTTTTTTTEASSGRRGGGASSSFAPTRRNSFLLNLITHHNDHGSNNSKSSHSSNIQQRRKDTLLNKRRRRSEAGDRAEEVALSFNNNGTGTTVVARLIDTIIRNARTAAAGSSALTSTAAVGLFLLVWKFWCNRKIIKAPCSSSLLAPSSPPPPSISISFQPLLKSIVEWIRLRGVTVAPRMLLQLYHKNKNAKSKSKSSSSSSHHRPTTTTIQNSNNGHVAPGGTKEGDTSVSFYNRYKQNSVLIHKILNYWFNQYDSVDTAEKKLWMIPSQQIAHRQHVDAEITKEFARVLLDLVNDSQTSSLWSEWCGGGDEHDDDDNDIYGYQGVVAAIIVLDQFSRHTLRHAETIQQEGAEAACSSSDDDGLSELLMSKLPEQSVCDELAYTTAKLFVKRYHNHNIDDIDDGDIDNNKNQLTKSTNSNMMIPMPMQVFALMPFRHYSGISSMQYVQQYILCMDQQQKQYGDLISRFRKATNRRMNILLDESRRTGGAATNGGDTTTDTDNDDNMLECGYMKVDMTSSQKHIVHETICKFFTNHTICNVKPASKTRAGIILSPPPTPIIVSLSGGVDSMVILSVLSYLQSKCLYHINIIALHIDYGNRPESNDEATYLENYCTRILGNVTFKCIRIDESMKRSGSGSTSRDDYERITRQIRYDFYRESILEQQQQQAAHATTANNSSNNNSDIGIILGHHRGDIRENVLSNAHRGCGPLDLSGMTSTSQNDGVTIFRPLLSLEKDSIYDYAHKFGVPYFKDTTPHWSTRGKLRNQLLPLLQEIYGDGSMNNITNLALESDDCRSLIHKLAFEPFLQQVQYKPMGITFPTASYKQQDVFFWKYVLREALHSASLGMFTDKSVKSFLERICANKLREGWLQCRKDYGVYLQEDGQVFVLYPSSFPWSNAQEQEYDKSKSTAVDSTEGGVLYGPDNAVRIGPWQISVSVVDDNDKATTTTEQQEDKQEELLEMKAIPCMDAFMNGSCEYYIKARTWQQQQQVTIATSDSAVVVLFEPRPLVFTSFTKQTRPRAWKNADIKIQQKLPLVGNDNLALQALKDPIGCGATHKTIVAKNGGGGTTVIEEKENPIVLVKVSLRLVVDK